jgi:hypothetical protein
VLCSVAARQKGLVPFLLAAGAAVSMSATCRDRSLELFPNVSGSSAPAWCESFDCAPDGGWCTRELCAPCGADSDCPAATPRCELASGTCVQCIAGNECPAGSVCNHVMHECATSCAGGNTCETGGVCNSDRICVGCLQDGDCRGPGQHCLLPQQQCSPPASIEPTDAVSPIPASKTPPAKPNAS